MQGYDVNGTHFNEWEVHTAMNAAVTEGLPTVFDLETGSFIRFDSDD